MTDYLSHLTNVGDSQISKKRKIDYIDYNFGKYLNIDRKLEVLEIGPGIGALPEFLNNKKMYSIDIIDNDSSVIDYIRSKYKIRNSFKTNDIRAIDAKLKKYDYVFMLQVFEHIPRSQYKSVLNTLVKHLKKDGKIIIMVPNGGNPLNMLERYHDIQHENAFTEDSLKELKYHCDLKGVSMETYSYNIPPNSVINIIRIIAQKLLHLFIILLIIINGGVFQYIMTPNITLIISKNGKE